MTVTIEHASHSDPTKYRINYDDAKTILVASPVAKNEQLPVIKTSSNVAIVGGGFAGIATAMTCQVKLNEQDFVIFEKHDNFGGTWYANTYPGCACDIPALWYSFFGELNTSWSEVQPPQYEMEEYILTVCKKHKLAEKARFKTSITDIIYDDNSATWTLHGRNVETGQLLEHTAKIVACCQGGLVHPLHLDVPGLDKFKGNYLHSAVWDHSVDFKDKKVVVVGNGCSAAQLVPVLVKDYNLKSLTQITRSKQYVMPPVPSFIQTFYNALSFSRKGMLLVRFITALVAELRYPMYKGNGLLSRILRKINTWISVKYMKKTCPEKYWEAVIPDYKIGCKRLVFDHHYLETLHDSRVLLRNGKIDYITEDSIVVDGEKFDADILVACTGYNLQKATTYHIVGQNNTDVGKLWKEEGVSAYNTLLIKECPNLFLIGGPNSATGHSSVLMSIENGCQYFQKLAGPVLSGKLKSVSVKNEKYDEWFKEIQAELKKSVFGSSFGGCHSWYTDGTVNYTAYPYSQIYYWWRTNYPRYKDLNLEQ